MPFIHWVMRSGMKAGLSIQPLHSCRTLAIPMPGLWYRFVIVSDFVYLLQYNCDTGLYLYLFLYLLQHKLWYRFVFVSVFCICYVWMTKYVLFKHPHQEDGRMEVFAQREIKKGDEVNMNAMADIFNISLWWPCLHFGDASPPRLLNDDNSDDKWSRWWSCTPPCCCRWWSPTPPCCPPSLKGRTSLLASGSSHAHAQGDIAYG